MSAQPHSDVIEPPAFRGKWYASSQAGIAYCQVTKTLVSEVGTKPEKELRSLERMAKRHLGDLCRDRSVKLVDLGTGDGEKMWVTIDALRADGARTVRYVPVDTNPHIARYAILNVLTKLVARPDAAATGVDVVDGEYIVDDSVVISPCGVDLDFFQRLPEAVQIAKQLGRGLDVFCLLGNTFGNYPAAERDAFLATLFAEIDAGDLFLLGVGLRPTAGSACAEQIRMLRREYLPGESFLRLEADHPESIYRLSFDAERHSMIHSFERPDRTMQQMGYSHLFAAGELLETIARHGFELLAQETYPELAAEPQYLTLLVRKPEMEHRL